MTEWVWLGCIIWLIGFVHQLASVNKGKERSNIEWPYPGAREATYIMLFFTWPYWFFYGR